MPTSGERELAELERVFKALAHATRRHILVLLRARDGQMTAGAIAARSPCSWPTTSRHLRLLEEAGLVSIDRHGREWLYGLEDARLNRVVGDWLKWFAPLQAAFPSDHESVLGGDRV